MTTAPTFPWLLLLLVQMALALPIAWRLSTRLHPPQSTRLRWAVIYTLALTVSFQAFSLAACASYH